MDNHLAWSRWFPRGGGPPPFTAHHAVRLVQSHLADPDKGCPVYCGNPRSQIGGATATVARGSDAFPAGEIRFSYSLAPTGLLDTEIDAPVEHGITPAPPTAELAGKPTREATGIPGAGLPNG